MPVTRGSKKDSDRAITPVEAVCVPAHLVPPGSPQAKQLCQLHAQLSLGRSATGKKKCLASVCTGLLWSCPALFDPVDCGLPGFSVRKEVFQARILECIGQYWLPFSSRALYFLLPQPPAPLSIWCCQNPCDPSSYSTSTPGPHRGKPKSSRAASGTNSSGRTTCRGGNKTTIETQGQCR